MKTVKTYIAIAAFSLTISGMLAQNVSEEGASLNSDYSAKKALDSQVSQKSNLQPVIASTNENRTAAAQLINYQAVARDAGGTLMTNAAVTIEFKIRDGAGGTSAYTENQSLTTDANGVFSAQIGAVTSLATVNWADIDPWLQVKLNGTNVGETQMASVPGALYSENSGSVMIYGSGTSNANKMFVQHSPAFPDWGMGYDDVEEKIGFYNAGFRELSINLNDGTLQTYGHLGVFETTTAPQLNRIYGNSTPIAFASVDAAGGISTGYGVTSITKNGTGVYDVVLNLNTNANNTIVSITPFTASIGIPEICGYNATGANTFTVNIQTVAGAGRDSAFSFVVYGNQ